MILEQGRDYTIHEVRLQAKSHIDFFIIQVITSGRLNHLTVVEP